MSKTLRVKCGPNGPVTKEGVRTPRDRAKPGALIDEAAGVVEVPSTRYYRGRVRAGDLVEVRDAALRAPTPNTDASRDRK